MKHLGGCHCGHVRFEVDLNLEKALACNCSICSKRGTLLDFVPEENFKLLSGASELTEYRFNKKAIQHLFCKTCGVASFSRAVSPDGKKMVAINLRCLDEVDVGTLKVHHYDGKSL